ncbi:MULTISPECIES: DUF2075 domain-containing protein [Sphingobacterium]|uniref:DUF2075 domain-containing protein n=1 Tax=Sphingobacterium TaxID=28453 RepID=UPI00257AC9F0|nr:MULTISPECIES: DUF2075 domain-containing protein [Sphingobacterium]
MAKSFQIKEYPFNHKLENLLLDHEDFFLRRPIIYLLKNNESKEVYVGETTDMVTRFRNHLKSEKGKSFTSVSLILSEFFNKSATLDIESNLIRYLAADKSFKLQNGNLGIRDHQFYQQKEIYQKQFQRIWAELMEKGMVKYTLAQIDNLDLFKYSPYKSLSNDQIIGLKTILWCLLDEKAKLSLIHGAAGTGKSIIAIFLFKLLKTDLKDFNYLAFDESDEELFELVKKVKEKYCELEMALVIPILSFRKTISKVFKDIEGLSSSMVISPSQIGKRKYDLLIIDEGHRLKRRKNLGIYYKVFDSFNDDLGLDRDTGTELNWAELRSDKTLIFYDRFQSLKPSDVAANDFLELEKKDTTRSEELRSQFRVRGGISYMDFIHEIFSDHTSLEPKFFKNKRYEFLLFDNLEDMHKRIKNKEGRVGLSRMMAGYAWEWKSRDKKSISDISIGGFELKWNSRIKWINSPNAINEVGHIETVQGHDLNYAGIIIGPELDYDFITGSFVVYRDRYLDMNGKNSIKDIGILKEYIFNIYRTMLFRSIFGTYVYVCNDNLRKYLRQYIPTRYALDF